MPRRRTGDAHNSGSGPDSSVLAALDAMRAELRSLRRGQLKLLKAVGDLRYELNHRLSSSREELGALVKASHAELSQRMETLDSLAEEQGSRLNDLERDFDDIFEPRT